MNALRYVSAAIILALVCGMVIQGAPQLRADDGAALVGISFILLALVWGLVQAVKGEINERR